MAETTKALVIGLFVNYYSYRYKLSGVFIIIWIDVESPVVMKSALVNEVPKVKTIEVLAGQ